MVPSPLPYDSRWTAKLFCRDIHNLNTKAITKIKARFARPSKPLPQVDHIVIAEPEGPQHINSSAPTAESARPSTLYELLDTHLGAMWASRDRDASPQDYWRFRCSWLVLWNAVQACPSNACYDVFEGPKADETALLLDLLDQSAKAASSKSHRISSMPAVPYQGDKHHVRIDSVFSSASSAECTMPKPTTSQLWHGILETATDATRITHMAEEPLTSIWPEKNAAEILDNIGNPSKVFCDDNELRHHLRDLLFPSYTTLSAVRQ